MILRTASGLKLKNTAIVTFAGTGPIGAERVTKLTVPTSTGTPSPWIAASPSGHISAAANSDSPPRSAGRVRAGSIVAVIAGRLGGRFGRVPVGHGDGRATQLVDRVDRHREDG